MDLNLDIYFEQRANMNISDKIKKFESNIKESAKIEQKPIVQSESAKIEQKPIVKIEQNPIVQLEQNPIVQLEQNPIVQLEQNPIVQLETKSNKIDNVTKIANKLKSNVDLTNKQPGMLSEEYKYTSVDFRKTYTVKELAEIWVNRYAMFVMWLYYDMGFMGKFKEPSGYLHRSVTALVMLPIHSHDKRLALVGLLDLMNHVDMHIRHKHTDVIKIGMAIDIVERIVPDLVGILQKLGFDNRVVNLAKDLVELLKLVINMCNYE